MLPDTMSPDGRYHSSSVEFPVIVALAPRVAGAPCRGVERLATEAGIEGERESRSGVGGGQRLRCVMRHGDSVCRRCVESQRGGFWSRSLGRPCGPVVHRSHQSGADQEQRETVCVPTSPDSSCRRGSATSISPCGMRGLIQCALGACYGFLHPQTHLFRQRPSEVDSTCGVSDNPLFAMELAMFDTGGAPGCLRPGRTPENFKPQF